MTLVDIGANPHHARECNDDSRATRARVAFTHRAIGECGLDFNRNYSRPPEREKWFEAQRELACEIGKPLFVSPRDACAVGKAAEEP